MSLDSTPFAKSNAIESASFVVAFVRGLEQPTIQRISAALESLKSDLPGAGGGTVDIRVSGMPQIPGLSIKAMEASRFKAKADGTHAWQVQAIGNLVQVRCSEYTNFGAVWRDARKYLLCALSGVTEEIAVAEIGFQVIDRFTYPAGADWSAYDMAELFNPATVYLTPKSFKAGAMWHVHQGWFDAHDGRRVLHQLNLTNTLTAAEQALQTVVDHRGALRGATDADTLDLMEFTQPANDGLTRLDSLFKSLHRQNRAVIEDLLTAEKLKSIGITKAP